MRHFILAFVIWDVSVAGAQAQSRPIPRHEPIVFTSGPATLVDDLTLSPQEMTYSSANDAKELAKAEKEYNAAKHSYMHHRGEKAKLAYVAATDRYAMLSMMGGSLPRAVKYRQALRLYREALKIDPQNHEAKNNSDLIISIYKSLHRPVPN